MTDKQAELEKEINRLNGLIKAMEEHNKRNYRYFDEAQKRLNQMEGWVMNQHAIRAPEAFMVCAICAKELK